MHEHETAAVWQILKRRSAARYCRQMVKLLAALLVCVPLFAASQPAPDWKLIWSDEFNGSANTPPNPTKWTFELGDGGWGNQELETYTNSPDNVSRDGAGHLVIRAFKTTSGYTSARLRTEGK